MKYNNETRKAKSEANKERIIEVAKRLFEEKNYDDVSVLDITNAAGVSKGAFYLHFETKEDLLQHIANEHFDKIKIESRNDDIYEEISKFIICSLEAIEGYGIHITQKWFSTSVMGSKYGKNKLSFDLSTIKEVLNRKYDEEYSDELSKEIVSIYYGALNLYTFTDGEIDPKDIVIKYLENELKERLK